MADQTIEDGAIAPAPKPAKPIDNKFEKNTTKPNRFRKRKLNNASDPPNKRAKASFEKKPEIITQLTYPTKTLELATIFTRITRVITVFYGILISMDSKMNDAFTALEFEYVVTMMIYYRCMSISNRLNGIRQRSLSCFKELLEHIQLPDVIASYVETFGQQTLSNTHVIIPYFRDFLEMNDTFGFVNPRTLLREIQDERGEEQPLYTETEWSLCPDVILKYIRGTAKATKRNINLRCVEWSNVEGREEFLAVFEDTGNFRKLEVKSYDRIPLAAAQLGAAYGIHRKDLNGIGDELPAYFAAPEVDWNVVLHTHFDKSLKSKLGN